MKTVLTLALLGALAAGPALARGEMGERSSEFQGQGTQQQGMSEWQGSQQQSGQQLGAAPQQALDESMVRNIQQQLRSQGYNLSVDGIYGPNTRQALQQFQQDQGMQATGRVDMDTLAALGVTEGGTQQAQTPEEQEQQRRQEQQRMQDQMEQMDQPDEMTR